MPTVEKTSGSRVVVRGVGEFVQGDQAEVDAETAAYLCEERGDFERIGTDDGESGDAAGYLRDEPPAVQIDEGVCPWCPPDDRYEGDAVGQHAASAHPDAWDDYKQQQGG